MANTTQNNHFSSYKEGLDLEFCGCIAWSEPSLWAARERIFLDVAERRKVDGLAVVNEAFVVVVRSVQSSAIGLDFIV